MTPAGTSNELDVQNEWRENTHTHTSLGIGSGLSNPETMLLRKRQETCRISIDELFHSTKSISSTFGIDLVICSVIIPAISQRPIDTSLVF